ncbi:polar amino acid transport system substrate-binding protein [Inhella inkyongensis]|uniref:Polar amino acid transport system substrate-binding protein n=1 Tax=Inhella inkyongensis TaxID=392593 RepID=A0A840S9J6_9BURK|nr:transporter substrate-binding domain-containing protein [Inhella inkyongensis]MBB5205191.1 polar amino acid transport system substrate-binding protein [Inhella inkyongensis]
MASLFRALPALLALVGLNPAEAQAPEPRALRVCLNDVPHIPWRMADEAGRIQREGLDFVFLDLLARRSGLQIQIALLPWKRCLADLKSGEQDAVLSMSYLPEREELGVYPMRLGVIDERLALRHNQYSWYVLQGHNLRWDGRKLSGLSPEALVGVQSGYSIGTVVREQGLKVDEGARTAESNLEKLVRGRVQLAALQVNEADRVLRKRPDLGARIQKLQPLLQERAYFTVFSQSFWGRYPRTVLDLWRDIATLRDSKAYREAENRAQEQIERETR